MSKHEEYEEEKEDDVIIPYIGILEAADSYYEGLKSLKKKLKK